MIRNQIDDVRKYFIVQNCDVVTKCLSGLEKESQFSNIIALIELIEISFLKSIENDDFDDVYVDMNNV